jgi:hypothetical protein
MPLDLLKPNLTAIQTAFTGRIYSIDLFTLYRAIAGNYSTNPSIVAGAAGLSVEQDFVSKVGAIGPFGRFNWVGDTYSIVYNQEIASALAGVPALSAFWPGWSEFTQALQNDANQQAHPFQWPGFEYALPVTAAQPYGNNDLILYIIYRGDVDSMVNLLTLLSQYMPEMLPIMPVTFNDLNGIFTLYGEWVNERFNGVAASNNARIMAKVVLLADYRWYLLLGDLLAMISSDYLAPGFTNGLSQIATVIRQEAEQIKITGG